MPKTQYHARHILVATQDAAQKIIAQLKKGAKFEDLAKKDSIDSLQGQGRGSGLVHARPAWSSRLPMRCVPLKKGEITHDAGADPVRLARDPAARHARHPPPPFDTVKDRIVQIVRDQEVQGLRGDERSKTAKVDKTLRRTRLRRCGDAADSGPSSGCGARRAAAPRSPASSSTGIPSSCARASFEPASARPPR